MPRDRSGIELVSTVFSPDRRKESEDRGDKGKQDVLCQLPFLAFLFGPVVTDGRRFRWSDESAQLEGVARCVVDELETVATEQYSSKPPRNYNNRVLDVQYLHKVRVNKENIKLWVCNIRSKMRNTRHSNRLWCKLPRRQVSHKDHKGIVTRHNNVR